jgi:hypothetical protein
MKGSLQLATDLSDEGGSKFESLFSFSSQPGQNGNYVNTFTKVGTSKVNIKFKNELTALNDAVDFKKDPKQGFCFNQKLDFPLDGFGAQGSAHGQIIVGRTAGDNGFSYWFLEAGVKDAFEIPIGVFDVAIYGFTGRLYSHMSHAGKDAGGAISNNDYVPSEDAGFGLYAGVPLKTTGDQGRRFYGDGSLEIATNANGGLESIVFNLNADLLSSGVGSTDQMIWGSINIVYVNAPSRYFDASLDANANFKSAVCAHA